MTTEQTAKIEPASDFAGPAGPGCDACGSVSRRVALSVGLAVGAAALAACTSSPQASVPSSSAASSASAAPSSAPASSAAATSAGPSSSSSAVGSSAATSSAEASAAATSAAPASSAASVPTTTNYGALEAIPEGSALIAGPEDAPIALARTGTMVVAFSAVCTHQGCTVNARGAQLICPCHASKFDPLTGTVQGGPAPSPLPSVAVQVVDGVVYGA